MEAENRNGLENQRTPERIIWCFGQWQPLYDAIRKKIPWIEFVSGLPDYLDDNII